MSDEKAREAKKSAEAAAMRAGYGYSRLAGSIIRDAELTVLRKIAADYLDDGEPGYWRMVEREIEP